MTPRSANQVTARRSTPIAVSALSSAQISAQATREQSSLTVRTHAVPTSGPRRSLRASRREPRGQSGGGRPAAAGGAPRAAGGGGAGRGGGGGGQRAGALTLAAAEPFTAQTAVAKRGPPLGVVRRCATGIQPRRATFCHASDRQVVLSAIQDMIEANTTAASGASAR